MYKAVLNFLRGQVLVHIESGCPERVVNLCAGADVPFWDVRWLSPVELTLRTTRRGLAQVRQAARQVGAAATVRREQGAPLLARRLRRRYVLLAGLLLTVLLVLTRWVKQTKKLHPILFILFSAVVGVAFGF